MSDNSLSDFRAVKVEGYPTGPEGTVFNPASILRLGSFVMPPFTFTAELDELFADLPSGDWREIELENRRRIIYVGDGQTTMITAQFPIGVIIYRAYITDTEHDLTGIIRPEALDTIEFTHAPEFGSRVIVDYQQQGGAE